MSARCIISEEDESVLLGVDLLLGLNLFASVNGMKVDIGQLFQTNKKLIEANSHYGYQQATSLDHPLCEVFKEFIPKSPYKTNVLHEVYVLTQMAKHISNIDTDDAKTWFDHGQLAPDMAKESPSSLADLILTNQDVRNTLAATMVHILAAWSLHNKKVSNLEQYVPSLAPVATVLREQTKAAADKKPTSLPDVTFPKVELAKCRYVKGSKQATVQQPALILPKSKETNAILRRLTTPNKQLKLDPIFDWLGRFGVTAIPKLKTPDATSVATPPIEPKRVPKRAAIPNLKTLDATNVAAPPIEPKRVPKRAAIPKLKTLDATNVATPPIAA